VKFLVASFMMLKVKRWTEMSDSKNKIEPIFRSTFDPVTDGDGFLINQKNLISQEVTGHSLLVLRTSASSKNNTKAAKDILSFLERLRLLLAIMIRNVFGLALMNFGFCYRETIR